MKRIFCLLAIFLSFSTQIVLANTKFKIEMQNYTDVALKFECKSITGHPSWFFPQGGITVPARTAVTEDVEFSIPTEKKGHEEIQCNYSGLNNPVQASGTNAQGLPLHVIEKTTHSVAIDPSFGGTLTLVVNPAITKTTQTGQLLDTHSEFVVSFESEGIPSTL